MDIFAKIDYKLVEILNLIEHEPKFPILARDLDNYLDSNIEHARLYDIYIKISQLRNL